MHKTFWLNGANDGRCINWLKWDALCAPKGGGGFGIKNMYAFNLALSVKQDWRLIYEPDSLVARVLKAKYHLKCRFLRCKLIATLHMLGRAFVLLEVRLLRVRGGS
ncbi:hypothetical protein DVH24_025794 [Malus domestica]|uniref:Reverse transcriptase zinc-binding domain-containing protein n=1 Tax=Malus domestica TaxID=3750 RepID=A0A498KG73_MALDO|nr:hypothetical protein DVH24_025794 [Malus domestica]